MSVHPLETRFVSVDREMNFLRDCSLGCTKSPISVTQEPLKHEKSNFATSKVLMYVDVFSNHPLFPH